MVIIFYLLGTFFLPSVISTDYSSVARYVDHLTTTTLSHASVLVVDGQDSLTNTVMDTLSDHIHIIANLHMANVLVSPVKQGWTLGLLGSAPVEPFLAALDGSVTRTIGKYECGLWDQTSPIVVVTNNQTHLEQFVQNRFFRRHPNFKIISPSSRKGFIVQSQYNIWEYSWTQSMKEITAESMLFSSPSFNLNGYKIALTFMPSNLDNINFYTNEEGEREYFGIMYEIATTIATSLNASFSLQVPPDETWGAIDVVDGAERWTGMLGLLYEDKMDAAVGSIFYLQSRVAISEIPVPIVNVYSTYVVPRPIQLPRWSSLIRPFSPMTWFAQGVVLTSMVFFTWLALRIRSNQENMFALNTTLMFVIPTFFAEDVTGTRAWKSMNTKLSLKVLLLSWVIFSCFNSFFYASLITASLTSPSMTRPIESLKEIVDSGLPYKLVFIDEVTESSWLRSSDQNIRNLVTDENVEKFPDFNPALIVGFVAEVAAREAVMVTYSNEVGWEVQINWTDPAGNRMVHTVDNTELSPPFMAGWLINKFFPGGEQIKWKMAAMFEAGLQVKMKEDTFTAYKERNPIAYKKSDGDQFMKLAVEDFQGIFSLLICGYVAATFAFCMELFVTDKAKAKAKDKTGTIWQLI